MITIYTGDFHGAHAHGLVRDIRLRWALEEAGIPYQVKLIGREDLATPAYRRLQPFGQIPAIEDDGLVLFETSAIVLHIGERSDVLLPSDPAGNARARTWVLAAVASVEPFISNLCRIDLFPSNPTVDILLRPTAEEFVKRRLSALAAWLGERDYLENRFTAGDLVMASVLKLLRHTDLVAQEPNLRKYLDRCEARPAFQRAIQEHMAVYTAS
jgi:glutathione S-transferase